MISYINTKFVLAALEKAPDTLKPQEIAAAARGLSIETPIGKVTMNPNTQRADMGYWYGETDVVDGKPRLVNFYRSGEKAK
jgi:ABC-type branched-subunit amino acid transport system substrate-binding protein